MFGREVSISHRHLDSPVSQERCRCRDVDASHDETARKGVSQIMPGEIDQTGLRDRIVEPMTGAE
jgi:hypothetical protein